VAKVQYIRERNKFIAKYGSLDAQKAKVARTQTINQEILSGSQSI
jgi:heme exporter protein D